MNRKEILADALKIVESREDKYGSPENNARRIAAFWNIYLRDKYGIVAKIEPVDVALMMSLVKIARLEETPDHKDSWVDLAGYSAYGAEVVAKTELIKGALGAYQEIKADFPDNALDIM